MKVLKHPVRTKELQQLSNYSSNSTLVIITRNTELNVLIIMTVQQLKRFLF